MHVRAEELIKNGNVRVLVNTKIPDEAIAVLGKGLGYVPTPNHDFNELRLDARRVVNGLSRRQAIVEEISKDPSQAETTDNGENKPLLPAKLRQPTYFLSRYDNPDPEVTAAINHINANINADSFQKGTVQSHNLSQAEKRGLSWLRRKVDAEELAICKADKGGAILLVQPNFLSEKVRQKVTDPELYEVLADDVRPSLYNKMIDLWKYGIDSNFVSPEEAKKVVGITYEGNKSTASRFKYGRTYFVPSLKIHKLSPEDLKPGVDIPVRLISCLQEGVSKRSDVYVAQKYLKDLEKDYCKDLVKDTTETLVWLEKFNDKSYTDKRSYTPFTVDFQALYDSLSHSLVVKALREALNLHRDDWPTKLKDWIIDLVLLSIEASVGEFMGKFYRQRKGLPTGGSLIVEIANITVYYVLQKSVYSDKSMMKNIVAVKRFIDDGVGIHQMTKRLFDRWKAEVSVRVNKFGLTIKEQDWNVPSEKSEPVNFLDISFWFDKTQSLQTDLYRKPTDARHYLCYTSCHPNYTFSGVVYSQGIRLRRIINNNERLAIRLEELKADFRKCHYPEKLIDNLFCNVKKMERILTKQPEKVTSEDVSVKVVTTHGRDKKLIKTLEHIEKHSESISFSYIKKTAPSLNNILVKSKYASLGQPKGRTLPCGRPNCMTCKMVSRADKITGPNGKIIRTVAAKCTTRCVVYHASCHFCSKNYVGKTIQPLSGRVNGHRGKFYECLRYSGDRQDLTEDDDHALGLHLYFQHGQRDTKGFNGSFSFTVLELCNPQNLDLKEHLWIQRLKTVKPYGLNSHDPFGFPFIL